MVGLKPEPPNQKELHINPKGYLLSTPQNQGAKIFSKTLSPLTCSLLLEPYTPLPFSTLASFKFLLGDIILIFHNTNTN